ncbi:MAG: lipase family protein [Trueperaceae bacterium]
MKRGPVKHGPVKGDRPGRPVLSLMLYLLLLALGWSAAQPGTLLDITSTGSLSAEAVDARVAGRFRSNGESAPAATTSVDTYLIRYNSVWPNGDPAEITAQLFVPVEVAMPESLLVFAPGSTGLVEACAPSRPFVEGGSYGTYNAYTLAFAGQGFAAVMPNYMGFFDVGVIQPYFDRVAEGRALLDAIRASEQALASLGEGRNSLPAFVAGYSQGGHAAFSAADLHAEYAPDTDLAGVVGFGPTTVMSSLFLEFTFVAPWVVYSSLIFEPGRIDPARMLAEPYLSRLASDAERLCILEAQSYYPASPQSLFRPEFTAALRERTLERDYPDVAEWFAENDAGLAGHGLPVIILQGVDDPVVHIDSQNRFVVALCQAGSAVRYPNYLRTRHETRYIGFGTAIDWMRLVASGESTPADDCADIPTGP